MVEVGDVIYSEGITSVYAIVTADFDGYFEVDFIGKYGELTHGSVPSKSIKKVWKNPQTVSKLYEHIGQMVFEHGFTEKENKQ